MSFLQEQLPTPSTRWCGGGGLTLTGLLPKTPKWYKQEDRYHQHAPLQRSEEAHGTIDIPKNRSVRAESDVKVAQPLSLEANALEFAEWSFGDVSESVQGTPQEVSSEEVSSPESNYSIPSSPPSTFPEIFNSPEFQFSPSLTSDLDLSTIDFDLEKLTGVSEKETVNLIGYGFPNLISEIPSIDTEHLFNFGDCLAFNEDHASTSSVSMDADDERSCSSSVPSSELESYAASKRKFSRKNLQRKKMNEKNLKIVPSSTIQSSNSWPISPVRIKIRKNQDPSFALLDSLPSNTNSSLSVAAMTQLALEDAYDLRLYIDYSRNLTLKSLQAYSNAVLSNEEYNGPITMVAAARIVIRESPRGMLELREITSELARRWPAKFARVNKGTLSTNTIRHALSFNKTFGNVSIGKKKNVWFVRPGMPVTNEKNLK